MESKVKYPNVEAERKKRGLILADIARVWDVTVSTASQKLNGKYPITFNEAVTLKKALLTDLTLEELFKEAR